LYEAGDAFCFTPENGESYNIALSKDDSRQNIQISKHNEVSISTSQGEDLGLKATLISDKDLQQSPCQ
jgi:hypothetical protein